MAETHILMLVAGLLGAIWWTKSWLMDPIQARWRFAVASLAGIPLWIFVAFSATRVVDTTSGVTTVYGSMALAYVAAFMAFVSVIGMVLGLFLWAEEEAQDASDELPGAVRPGRAD